MLDSLFSVIPLESKQNKNKKNYFSLFLYIIENLGMNSQESINDVNIRVKIRVGQGQRKAFLFIFYLPLWLDLKTKQTGICI